MAIIVGDDKISKMATIAGHNKVSLILNILNLIEPKLYMN